jgi:protein gp37
MNRTRIEWADMSWNPITGCTYGCPYCYARWMTARFPDKYPNGFEPTVWLDRMADPVYRKTPTRIFACSMGDMFDPNFRQVYREMIVATMRQTPQHTYIILTKQPQRINVSLPENVQIGVTVDYPHMKWRIETLREFPHPGKKLVSFEPLLGDMTTDIDLSGIDGIFIGACSGATRKIYRTQPDWVANITYAADRQKVPVFLKDNLKPIGINPLSRREFPK